MKRLFIQSFTIQAIEKALNRGAGSTLGEEAMRLNIGEFTFSKWIVKAPDQEFKMVSSKEIDRVTKQKRPYERTAEERLEMVNKCAFLDDESIHASVVKLEFVRIMLKNQSIISSIAALRKLKLILI
jgi:hypothetical protein